MKHKTMAEVIQENPIFFANCEEINNRRDCTVIVESPLFPSNCFVTKETRDFFNKPTVVSFKVWHVTDYVNLVGTYSCLTQATAAAKEYLTK